MLPYLYNLFVDQEERGEAILRPLFYNIPDRPGCPLADIEDQFMVGPAIMQAPFVEEGRPVRSVVLPRGRWYAAAEGKWMAGDRRIACRRGLTSTPLFLREGTVAPMQPGERTDQRNDLSRVEFHLFVRESMRGRIRYRYQFDDGESLAYRRGQCTRFALDLTRRGERLQIRIGEARFGSGPCRARFVVYGSFRDILLLQQNRKQELALRPHKWNFGGRSIRTLATEEIVIGDRPQ
jgi:alpha-glucosidase